MNHLDKLKKLNNRYFGMRHGEAESNEKGIIISDPAVGVFQYPLTKRGQEAAAESAEKCGLGADTVIVSSDFLRARQTAEVACEKLGVVEVKVDTRLRERFFGDFEGGPDNRYADIWDEDHKNPNAGIQNVEPAEHLLERVTSLVLDLEGQYIGETILLVSHGDPLQFLETAFNKVPIYEHQKYPLFDLAEIKELRLSE